MSFMSNYYAELKKLKKKEEELDSKGTAPYRDTSANKAASSSEGSFMDRFYEELSKVEAEEEDIAPILPVLPSVRNYSSKPWYKKGHFEDGYDIGDVTKTILGIDEDSASLKELTWGSLKKGYQNARYGEESFYAMEGKANQKEAYEKLLESEEYQFTPGNKLASGISGAFELLGQQARQFTHPRTLALTGGAAGMAAIAGQAGPQVLVPEEVVSVPLAAVAGFKTGSTASALEIEAGLAYNEMLEYGIKEETARKIALGVGSINAGLEALQVDELLDAYKITSATGATKSFTKRVLKELADRGIDVAKETAQEVAQEGVTIAGTQIASKIDKGELAYSAEDVAKRLLDTAQSSALSFGMMNVPAAAKNTISIANDQKMTGSLTDNEQKVVDKVVEDIVSGREVSQRQKNEITKSVIERMEKGYISTDTIEEVLGGDSYQAYKDSLDAENTLKEEQKTLQEEFKTLGGKTNATLAEQARYTELGQKLTEIQAKLDDANTIAERNALKAQLDKEVYELTKGDKLRESFFEVVRSKQKYEADLSRYEGKAREVIKQVMDSELVDNSNQTHEFWDLMANLSARGETTISVASNEDILKLVRQQHEAEGVEFDESQFKGQIIDGFTDGKRIVLNAETPRALNFVVGHEITHNLEKTKHYGSLQKLLIEFAGDDYKARFNQRQGQYANKFAQDEKFNSKVNMEVTGDLVGDYLFTNKDFVTHLAKDRNVFQRVWDEIKYFCKIATAGSEQARQLEQVKREFERAWRETNKAQSETKYSFSGKNEAGIEVYETSDSVMELTWDERKAKYLDVMKNEYRGRTAKFERNGHTYYAKFDQSSVRKPIYGDSRSSPNGKKALIKAGADGDVFNLVENSKYTGSKPNTKDHTKADYFDYFVKTVQIDGKVFDLMADVEKQYGVDGGYVYTLALVDNKKIKASPAHGTSNTEPVKNAGNAFSNNVPQESMDVKYSLSDSDGKQLTKEQQEYFGEHGLKDDNGNLLKLYRSADGGRTVWDGRGSGSWAKGIFLTDDPYVARAFAAGRTKGDDILEVYAKAENPFIIDAQGNNYMSIPLPEDAPEWLTDSADIYDELNADQLPITAFENGYDAVIIKNVREGVGGDPATDVVLRDANQFKRTDNTNPTADKDIRFSLSNAVEETKDLVALHNLTEDKLLKSLELGGMPMPSLAVTKADIPHSNFGEITLIFGRETIDPKANKKNKVYSADAWTPVFPRVEYEADSDVENRISRKLLELEGKVDDYFQRDIRMMSHGFEDYLNRNGGEEGLIQRVLDNYGMKAAYLEEQGNHIDKVTMQQEAEKGYNPDHAERYQKIMDILGVTTAEEIAKVNLKDARDNHGAELEAVYPGITKSAMRMGRMFGVVKSYLESKDSGPEYKTVTDSIATRKAVDDALDAGGYEAWVRNLFSGIVKDSGIYNNKDLFTPSGNRRTFKQTHLPVTLENIVKAMATQNDGNAKNVSGFNGVKTLRAATAETFKSVEEMHKRKGRLQNRAPEEAEALTEALQTRLYKIIEAIDNESGQAGGDNSFIRFDSIGEILTEIGEGGKYNVADIQKAFRQYSRELSDDTAMEVKQLLYDVAQMPVNIFEAKPQRVVGFDEAKVFVIPYDSGVKLKQELLNRGYNIAEYDPKVEGDRQRVVNQFEEYKFSLSNVGETPYQGKQYGTWNVYAKDMLWKPEIAPVAENATTVSKTESVAPVMEEPLPDAESYSDLLAKKADLESKMMEAVGAEDFDTFNQINEAYSEVMARIEDMEQYDQERVDSLDDAEAPPEMEAPYQEREVTTLTQKATADIVRNVRASLGLNNMQMADARNIIEQYRTGEIRGRGQLISELQSKFGRYTEKGRDEQIAEAQAFLKTIKVYVPDHVKRGIADFNKVRQSNFGKIRFSKEGAGIDQVYQDELMANYPEYFPASIDTEEDQLRRMIEVANWDANTETERNLDMGAIEEAADAIIHGITEFRRNQDLNLSEREARAGFKSLLREADHYAPIGEDISPEKLQEIRAKAKLDKEFSQRREALKDKSAYISQKAGELYDEIRSLKKGVRASDMLGELLDYGYDWSSVRSALVNIKHTPGRTVNVNSGIESVAREMLNEDYEDSLYNLESEYRERVKQLKDEFRNTEPKVTRKVLHEGILNDVKAQFTAKGFDFDRVLRRAKNLSTFSTVDNTPQRVMEKALGYKEGQILSDITVNKVAQNETDGIKWLNSYTGKEGLLRQISRQYGIKPGSKESAAAQMFAEGFYVDDANEIIQYGNAELAADFPDESVRNNIKRLAGDPRIRKIYDDTLAMINESRTRNAYPEIPRLDNYFLHFRAMEDTFSKLGLPFNPNDIRAKDLPTDLNGVTADLKPGQPFFASAMHRKGKRTSFDLLGGLEKYLTSAKNQIYHIDDIQTLRALRNYIADTYGQANGLEGLDVLSEEEQQDRIEKVYNSHLSTFAKFLNEEANILAGKTALIDRGLEGIIGRRGITFLNTVNGQVGKNMVGYNISSSLTNFLPVAQTFAKTNKFDFVKAFGQTVANKVGTVFGRNDGFAENSPVIIRRKGAESFYRTPYQKVGDVGYVFMSAVDNISTELIARTKYNELTRKGMDSQQAHFETDKWVSKIMGDRSLGQQPQLYNSKMLGLITKFQMEVRNQLDSQFYDTIQETKVSNEKIQNELLKNAKTAAKITSTFVQLAVVQHLFGKAFESIAGYNPAFDIIEVLMTACGWDDEEESEDTALDNIEQGFLALLEDLPYTGTFTGGRIPISSALPIGQFIKGVDEYGNEKSRWETLGEVAPYYVLPGGYGQIKKTTAGLGMFSEDHPIAGSYTDSGNLRFPVEDTMGNRIQAGIFGQWASDNARDYFDNERKALNEKQTQEYIELDMPIRDYWDYREELKKQETLEDKFDYIAGLDVSVEQKNIMINNVVDRKEKVDMENYDDFGSYEEFDWYTKNTEKYTFLQKHGISYKDYKSDEDTKDYYDSAYEWYNNNPEKVTVSEVISEDFMTYYQYKTDISQFDAKDANGETVSGLKKERVTNYINGLDLDYGQKLILFKSYYDSKADKEECVYGIVEYLNNRADVSYEEMKTILEEIGYKVDSQGNIYWD